VIFYVETILSKLAKGIMLLAFIQEVSSWNLARDARLSYPRFSRFSPVPPAYSRRRKLTATLFPIHLHYHLIIDAIGQYLSTCGTRTPRESREKSGGYVNTTEMFDFFLSFNEYTFFVNDYQY
jgi:hypothetical protein